MNTSTSSTPRNSAVIFAAMLTLVLGGCIQSIAADRLADTARNGVSEAAISAVNASFHRTFAAGGWYYKGAENIDGTINAYIQIPARLEMSSEAQQNYLKQSICPSVSKTEFWKQLRGVPLAVHIYTYRKTATVHAHCDNPTV